MDEIVTIQAQDVQLEADSQVCGLAVGDQISMDQLFHAPLSIQPMMRRWLQDRGRQRGRLCI
ncbi:MAG: hypothetical protein ACLRMZ_05390 [Blautia marasmi]